MSLKFDFFLVHLSDFCYFVYLTVYHLSVRLLNIVVLFLTPANICLRDTRDLLGRDRVLFTASRNNTRPAILYILFLLSHFLVVFYDSSLYLCAGVNLCCCIFSFVFCRMSWKKGFCSEKVNDKHVQLKCFIADLTTSLY